MHCSPVSSNQSLSAKLNTYFPLFFHNHSLPSQSTFLYHPYISTLINSSAPCSSIRLSDRKIFPEEFPFSPIRSCSRLFLNVSSLIIFANLSGIFPEKLSAASNFRIMSLLSYNSFQAICCDCVTIAIIIIVQARRFGRARRQG